MNLDSLNKWLTLIANLGVLLGIAFLAIEINLNTKAVESDVAWSRSTMATSLLFEITSNQDFAEAYAEFQDKSEEEILDAIKNKNVGYVQYQAWWRAERSYWESRYLTQTSEDERLALQLQMIGMLGNHPGAKTAVFTATDGLNGNFRMMLEEIKSELE